MSTIIPLSIVSQVLSRDSLSVSHLGHQFSFLHREVGGRCFRRS